MDNERDRRPLKRVLISLERAKIGVKPNSNRTFYHHETSSAIRCVSPGTAKRLIVF